MFWGTCPAGTAAAAPPREPPRDRASLGSAWWWGWDCSRSPGDLGTGHGKWGTSPAPPPPAWGRGCSARAACSARPVLPGSLQVRGPLIPKRCDVQRPSGSTSAWVCDASEMLVDGETQAAGFISNFRGLPRGCPSIRNAGGQSGIAIGGKGETISQLTLAGNNCFESSGLISGFHTAVSLSEFPARSVLAAVATPSPSAASEVSLKPP